MTPELDLKKLGVFDFAALKRLQANQPPPLIDGLLAARSLNMLVGDSNLGKTPLALTMAVAVASGLPFFGRKTTKGRVLYFDAESSPGDFVSMWESISTSMGLSEPAPLLVHFMTAKQEDRE